MRTSSLVMTHIFFNKPKQTHVGKNFKKNLKFFSNFFETYSEYILMTWGWSKGVQQVWSVGGCWWKMIFFFGKIWMKFLRKLNLNQVKKNHWSIFEFFPDPIKSCVWFMNEWILTGHLIFQRSLWFLWIFWFQRFIQNQKINPQQDPRTLIFCEIKGLILSRFFQKEGSSCVFI